MYRIEEKDAFIRRIQLMLSVNQTGKYDKNTKNSVAELQKKYNLDQSGTIDYKTFNAILNNYKKERLENSYDIERLMTPSFPYKIGDRGSNIGIINSLLRTLFENYTLEGKMPYGDYYGTDTAAAVSRAREIFLLSSGNEVDSALYNRLTEEIYIIGIKSKLN